MLTPTLRNHELPLHEGAMKIAPLSMRDYTDDPVALVDSLDTPPLLVGLSWAVCWRSWRQRAPGMLSSSPPAQSQRQASSLQPPRRCGPTGASSGGTIYGRDRGPSRCIPQRGSGGGGGSPTPRPRRSPASSSPIWSASRGAPTASSFSHFWTGKSHHRQLRGSHDASAHNSGRMRPSRAATDRSQDSSPVSEGHVCGDPPLRPPRRFWGRATTATANPTARLRCCSPSSQRTITTHLADLPVLTRDTPFGRRGNHRGAAFTPSACRRRRPRRSAVPVCGVQPYSASSPGRRRHSRCLFR